MSLLKKNIIANFIGSFCQTVMGLIFIPLYIKFLGIEAWGLVGIFATLQILFSLFDMGLGSTINREMARLSALANKEQEMRDLVHTLEILYWGIAIFVGIIVIFLSPYVANHWINNGELSSKTIKQALLIMGFVITLQMPVGFYSGGLMGLQKQVLLNIINVLISITRGAGAVLILWLISPTIQTFFLWQIVISGVNILFLKFSFWKNLPSKRKKPRFQKILLKGIWKFAAGMTGITMLVTILTQLDKIILSKMLSLETFGYYALASMAAMSLGRICIPFFYSIYPKLTQLVLMEDENRLKNFYHECCQFMSVLILPIACIIAFFSYEILLIWTHNPEIAEKSHLLLSILICGSAINGIMYPPFALQLSLGWTSLSFYKNLLALIFLVPLIIYLTTRYGAVGGASVWLILNIGYFIFEIPILHNRLLKKEKWRWYWKDICLPLVSSILIVGLGRVLINGHLPNYIMIQYLIILLAFASLLASLTVPVTRFFIFKHLKKITLLIKN